MKKYHPTPSETPETNLTQFAAGRADFHPLAIRGNEVLRWFMADQFPPHVFEPFVAKHKLENGKIPAEAAVRTISPLKCRRFPPIFESGTVPGNRRWPEGKPGGRLIKGLPHGRDAV